MKEEIILKAKKWTSKNFDQATREEIKKLLDAGDIKELENRFYTNLDFGTGGMRGIMGAGTNRMNKYTVGVATQGLASYLLKNHPDASKMGVAIAYDSRNNSPLFARETAMVLAANGIKVYIFPKLRPTPLLSFAVRYLGCVAGVVITASHNPKEYNGYKVYGSDGGQVVSPEDVKIVEYVNRVDILKGVKRIDYKKAVESGLIQELDEKVENEYLKRVEELSSMVEEGLKDTLYKLDQKVRVVYTPLHGTGVALVPAALKKLGGVELLCEKEQSLPDGNFSTTPSPNPEEREALSRAINYANENGADLVIATDPDCDRMGLAVSDRKGGYEILSGNQIGCLIGYMIMNSFRKSGKMAEKPFLVTTVVSTEMAECIARSFNVETVYVLTGFKYIAEKIREYEKNSRRQFIYGFEESYGYLAGDFVRDKDGVIASLLAVILLKYANCEYGSIHEMLLWLYRKYGMFQEYQKSFTLSGVEGQRRIESIMEKLRSETPQFIGARKVLRVKDYLMKRVIDTEKGEELPMEGFPISNVLQFYTDDKIRVSVRPSGTEPKIKFYFSLSSPMVSDADKTKKLLDNRYREISTDLFQSIGLM